MLDEAIKLLGDHGRDLEKSARGWRARLMNGVYKDSEGPSLNQGINDAELTAEAIRVVLAKLAGSS